MLSQAEGKHCLQQGQRFGSVIVVNSQMQKYSLTPAGHFWFCTFLHKATCDVKTENGRAGFVHHFSWYLEMCEGKANFQLIFCAMPMISLKAKKNNFINFTKVGGKVVQIFLHTLKWNFPPQGLLRVKMCPRRKPQKNSDVLYQNTSHLVRILSQHTSCDCSVHWGTDAAGFKNIPWGWAVIAPPDLIPGGQTWIYCITELLPEQAIPDCNENTTKCVLNY